MAKKTPSSTSSSNCIGEASQACFHGCCVKPSFLSLPYNEVSSQSHHSQKSEKTSTNSTTSSALSSQHKFIVATLSSLHPNTPQFTNHESLPPLHESLSYFIKSFPQFSQTQQVDRVRSRDYYHLALSNHVCLDYVGIGLFSCASKAQASSIASSSSSIHHEKSIDFPESSFFDICYKAVSLKSQLLHGSEESELELKIRKRIMDFMNVSEDEYTMVFTSNQSSAFKLIADAYPFHSHRNLLMVCDYASEALEAMTESSKKRGARVFSAEFSWPNMILQTRKLRKIIVSTSASSSTSAKHKVRTNKGLFVFPLQSRMTGSRYSYQWMSVARENGWHVLLDACALGPKDMETLGLSLFKPDFLVCSFYKVFGENPSGFGCLFVKKSTSSILTHSNNTSTASIGIVSLVPSSTPNITISHLEDKESAHDQKSTLDSSNYIHNIEQDQAQASEIVELVTTTRSEKSYMIQCKGLDHADSLGLVMISARSRFLINWLVNALTRLQHPYSENGNPLIRIYGPKIGFDRGPSLAFNVFDWKGEKIDPILVQKLADRNNISLSYGFLEHVCFVDKSEEDRQRRVEICSVTKTSNYSYYEAQGKVLSKERESKEQSAICVITATIGLVTNFEDIYRLWAFVARFLDADFVEKERWRYLALNQTTIEV